MSILDMDVTAHRDPAYIRNREFARVRKGYDPDQVRDFLHELARWFDDLETDLATARVEAERMVNGLMERRNALSAELHATKTRLMGIVTRLEEDPAAPEPGPS